MTPEVFGKITLYKGDCMEYLRTLPDNAFDLAIVDPPYGIDIGNGLGTGKKTCKMHQSWQFNTPPHSYFLELMRVSKNQIIWGGNYFGLPPTRCFLIWRKLSISEKFSMAMVEYAWTSFNANAKIFEHTPQGTKSDPRFHPTQKPIALYKWLLTNYAKEGDKILDTHLGSGSICIAAHDLGFELTGIELDPSYYEAAKQRLIKHQQQLTLF